MGSLRSAKRHIARVEMKKAGVRRPCSRNGRKVRRRGSWFSYNWKDFLPKPDEKKEIRLSNGRRG